MSSYFFLGLAFICLVSGAFWNNSPLLVMGSVFISAAVIIARCDTIITLLRSKQ